MAIKQVKSFNIFLRVMKLKSAAIVRQIKYALYLEFILDFCTRETDVSLYDINSWLQSCKQISTYPIIQEIYILSLDINQALVNISCHISFSFTQFFPPCFVDNVLLSRRFNHVTLFFGNTSDVIGGARNSKMAAPMKIGKLFRFPIFMN